MLEEYRDIITVEELCDILNMGKNAVYCLLSSGELHCFRYNRTWKIPKEGVIEYIKTQSSIK